MNSRLAQVARTPPRAAEKADGPAPHAIIRLLERAIFYGLLLLMILVAIPYGSAEVWWESFFECAVFALSLLWIIEGLLSGSWLFNRRALLLPILAFIAFAVIQTLPLGGGGAAATIAGRGWYAISADPFETRRLTFKLVALVLCGLFLMRYGATRKRLRALVHVIICVAVASALFGILRQTTQRETGFFLPFLEKGSGYGQFINQNHFAFLMEMALGLVLGLLVGRGIRRDRMLIYVAMLLPVWTALVLSGSRGGLLGMLGQLIFVALLFTIVPPAREETGPASKAVEEGTLHRLRRIGRSLPVRLALAACLVLAMIVGVLFVGGEPVMGRLESVHSELAAQGAEPGRQNASRKEIWQSTWRLIKAHPLAGVGFGGYWAAIPTYHDASGELTPQQAHNDYLELLASGGIIALVLGAWFLYLFIKRARERLRGADQFCRAACFGALVALFGVAVHSLVDFGLHITINALVFVALLAIAASDCQHTEEPRAARRARRGSKSAEAGSMALSA